MVPSRSFLVSGVFVVPTRKKEKTHIIFFAFLETAQSSLKKNSKRKKAECGINDSFPRFVFFGLFLDGPSNTCARNKRVGKCGICRSRQALSNGTLIAKIGVDKAENEPIQF